jgi:hypothetical protein
MLEIDPVKSKRHGKIYFRKTWLDRILNVPLLMVFFVGGTIFIAAKTAYSLLGEGEMAFQKLAVIFSPLILLVIALFIWAHFQTGRLYKFAGHDIESNKEIARTLCQELGWAVVAKHSSYDLINMTPGLFRLIFRRAVIFYDRENIMIGVVSYNWMTQPGLDFFLRNSLLARSFGKKFLAKLN